MQASEAGGAASRKEEPNTDHQSLQSFESAGREATPPPTKRPASDTSEPRRNKRNRAPRDGDVRGLLAKAQSVRDLLALPGVQDYLQGATARGVLSGLQMQSYWAEGLPTALKRWAFDLTRRNMEDMYSRTWGWSNAEKRRELNHNEARFLVITEQGGNATEDADRGQQPVAFAHVRFVDEEGVPSVYLYELQLEPRVHRRGLGTVLMRAVEHIGTALQMRQSVLSVLKINEQAQRFYTQGLGYGIDWTSPDRDPSGACLYFILSKAIVDSSRDGGGRDRADGLSSPSSVPAPLAAAGNADNESDGVLEAP